MLGPFRVGDRPADQLDLIVSRTGDDAPLSGFTTAQVQMQLPDRTMATPWAGTITAPNIIRSSWPAAFTQAGLHKVRARLTGASAQEDLPWVKFWVRPA